MTAVQGAEQMGQMELLLNVYASQKVLIRFLLSISVGVLESLR